MDILGLARAMGKAIQSDEKYKTLSEASANCDNDKELQDEIGKFNLKRVEINQLAADAEKNKEKLVALDEELRTIYEDIMANPNMTAFNNAKNEMDTLMNQVNQILVASVNGEDPDTYEPQTGCSGSCSSCSGCH